METMYTYAALVIAICYVIIAACIVELIKHYKLTRWCEDDKNNALYDEYLNTNSLEDSVENEIKFVEIYYDPKIRRYVWWYD